MAFPSVTYTFANSTTADGTQVNQNFTDIINGVSDGTKSISISALTAAGTTNLQGTITLGASSSNILTVNCSLGSSIPVQTTNAYDIGSDTFGLRSVYLGGGSSAHSTRIIGASVSAAWTLTLPVDGGTNLYVLQTNGSGTTTWAAPQQNVDWFQNYSLSTSVNASAMTVTMAGAGGTALSGSNVASFMFRNATAATGQTAITTITGNLSIVIPSGATLGTKSAVNQYVYVYIVADASNELAVSASRLFDEGSLQTCTAITSGSTSATTLYSTSTHTSKPVRYIGRILVNEATAGTWASNSTEISLFTSYQKKQERSEVVVGADNGYGSTNTMIARFAGIDVNTGTAITYADSATNGGSFTINEQGIYCITYQTGISPAGTCGISRNSTQLTTAIYSITRTDILARFFVGSSQFQTGSVTLNLNVGDIIRAHNDATAFTGSTTTFRIVKISD